MTGRSARGLAGTRRRGEAPDAVRSRSALVDTFLLPPRTPSEWSADAVRAIGFASFIAATIGWGALESAVLALSLLGLVLPRFLGVRASIDLSVGIVLLIAAWCSVLDLYRSLSWVDVPIHFALNGLLALLAVVVAERAGMVLDLRRWPLFGVTVSVGLALAAVWEVAEWVGNRIDDAVFVGYDDTILDMAMGGAGAALAAFAVPAALRAGRWRGDDSRRQQQQR